MKKKIVLGAITLAAVAGSVAMLSAFEAHVINVTARIENALQVTTEAIDFGTVFPQEELEKPVTVELSSSFIEDRDADDVDYIIRQKPKCGITSSNGEVLVGPTATGHVNSDGTVDCGPAPRPLVTGETWGVLPSLCEYISKEGEDQNDGDLPSFHKPWTIESGVVVWNEVKGRMAKSEDDTKDTWVIDLAVPCFGDHCAQDWEEFVHEHNPDADASQYVLDADDESKVFGCDLWIEVTGVSRGGTPPPPTTGTITVTKVLDLAGLPLPAGLGIEDFALEVGTEAVVSGVAEVFAPGAYVLSETEIGEALALDFTTSFSGDADCSDGSLDLSAGESISCTITNTLLEEI